ncbi:MAG: fibronectin type III domain-containing protein [Holophagales bacterium]|nr:fibronectin type III domain-containing protein [Holophagales bacterium]
MSSWARPPKASPRSIHLAFLVVSVLGLLAAPAVRASVPVIVEAASPASGAVELRFEPSADPQALYYEAQNQANQQLVAASAGFVAEAAATASMWIYWSSGEPRVALQPETTYSFRVRAVYGEEDQPSSEDTPGPWSEPVTVTTSPTGPASPNSSPPPIFHFVFDADPTVASAVEISTDFKLWLAANFPGQSLIEQIPVADWPLGALSAVGLPQRVEDIVGDAYQQCLGAYVGVRRPKLGGTAAEHCISDIVHTALQSEWQAVAGEWPQVPTVDAMLTCLSETAGGFLAEMVTHANVPSAPESLGILVKACANKALAELTTPQIAVTWNDFTAGLLSQVLWEGLAVGLLATPTGLGGALAAAAGGAGIELVKFLLTEPWPPSAYWGDTHAFVYYQSQAIASFLTSLSALGPDSELRADLMSAERLSDLAAYGAVLGTLLCSGGCAPAQLSEAEARSMVEIFTAPWRIPQAGFVDGTLVLAPKIEWAWPDLGIDAWVAAGIQLGEMLGPFDLGAYPAWVDSVSAASVADSGRLHNYFPQHILMGAPEYASHLISQLPGAAHPYCALRLGLPREVVCGIDQILPQPSVSLDWKSDEAAQVIVTHSSVAESFFDIELRDDNGVIGTIHRPIPWPEITIPWPDSSTDESRSGSFVQPLSFLQFDTDYCVRARARSEVHGVAGDWSPFLCFTTEFPQDALVPPSGMALTSGTSPGELLIHFTPSGGDATAFQFVVLQDEEQVALLEVPGNQVTAGEPDTVPAFGLQPATEYCVRGRAVDADGEVAQVSEWAPAGSGVCTTTPTQSLENLLPPSDITLEPTPTGALQVSWQPPPQDEPTGFGPAGFDIRLVHVLSGEEQQVSVPGVTEEVIITTVEPASTYCVQVRTASFGSGVSDWVPSSADPINISAVCAMTQCDHVGWSLTGNRKQKNMSNANVWPKNWSK